MLAVAVSRYKIQLYRLDDGADFSLKVLATLESPDRSPLRILAFSQDGSRLAAATKNQLVQIWNLNRLREELAALGLGDDFPILR
jgi:hypothetical protein